MTPDEYITENYENIKKWLSGVTQGDRSHLFEDLVHEVIIIFLEHDKAQEAVDTGTARFFLVRIALNQWRSSTSPFARQNRDSYLDYDEQVLYNIEDTGEYDNTLDIATDAVTYALDDLYQGNNTDRYDAIMIIMYYSMNTNYSAVGRMLNIPHSTVRKVVLRGIKKLKNKINNGKFTDDNRIDTHLSDIWGDDSRSDKQQTISMATQLLRTRYFRTV